MTGCIQAAGQLARPTMHEAADRHTGQLLRQDIELFDQRRQHGPGIEQINGNEVIRNKHPAEAQILFDPIAEHAARKYASLPPCCHDAALAAAPRASELPGKPLPGGQVDGGNRLTHQGINRANVVP